MSGFKHAHTEANMPSTYDVTFPAHTMTGEEIAMHVARGERLRAAQIAKWSRHWAQSLASLWHQPGRMVAKPLA